jgi:hypothetical protein
MNKMNETNLTLNSSWGTGDGFSGSITVGGGGNITGGGWYDPNYYYPVIQTYYPSYFSYWHEDKVAKSFKLIQTLIKIKIIKEPKTVKDFIELVNAISEII